LTDFRAVLAPQILPVVLANVTTRYPYHDTHFFQTGGAPHDPFAAHPAFGNSFDWHSSVHSHWTALQLIAYFSARPDEAPPQLESLVHAIETNLTREHLAVEAAYLASRPSYERPYGWAWALELAAASHAYEMLAQPIRAAIHAWLAIVPEPVRHGVHSNTAFALAHMLDAARMLCDTKLEGAIVAKSLAWFVGDRAYPIGWERSGNDFLSPGLAQADLLRRVLSAAEFSTWWNAFLPPASHAAFSPVAVPESDDGHVVHLHGLNLSRAEQLAAIARGIRDERLLERARTLYAASVEQAYAGPYVSTHWLPTFAWRAACALNR
jgi:hypothetical protein